MDNRVACCKVCYDEADEVRDLSWEYCTMCGFLVCPDCFQEYEEEDPRAICSACVENPPHRHNVCNSFCGCKNDESDTDEEANLTGAASLHPDQNANPPCTSLTSQSKTLEAEYVETLNEKEK